MTLKWQEVLDDLYNNLGKIINEITYLIWNHDCSLQVHGLKYKMIIKLKKEFSLQIVSVHAHQSSNYINYGIEDIQPELAIPFL